VVFGVGLQQPALGRPQPINRRDAGDGGEHEVLAGRQKPTNMDGGTLGSSIRRVGVKAPQDGFESAFKAAGAVSPPANTPQEGRRGVNGQAWWTSPKPRGIGQRRQVGQWYSVKDGWTHGEGPRQRRGLNRSVQFGLPGPGLSSIRNTNGGEARRFWWTHISCSVPSSRSRSMVKEATSGSCRLALPMS